MAIDNPLDALNQQFENEDRSSDPVLTRLITLISELPWPAHPAVQKIIALIIGRLGADRIRKLELLSAVMQGEIRRHDDQLRKIGEQPNAQARFEEWSALVVDGFKRAEQTRAKERVD